MTPVRTAFVSTAEQTAALLRGDVLAQHWDDDSALADMTTGALAAHLGRAVLVTRDYLLAEPPSPDAPRVDAPGYYLAVLGDAAHDDAVHVGVRARAEADGTAGPAALAARVDEALHQLRAPLEASGPDRLVSGRDGTALLLDDYLDTRIVELVVHLDDVAASVGLGALAIDEVAAQRTVGVLAELARRRHSTGALVHALARRERVDGPFHAI